MPSRGRDEGYGMLGNIPGVREWTGDRVFNSIAGAQFVIANKLWEDSIEVQKVDIDDDRLNMYGMLFEQLGVEAMFHPDELMFDAQIAGDSQPCFDGQYFYDTDHSWGKSGTQSNKLTYGISTATWVASKAYVAGDVVINSSNQYVAKIGGTSAGSGGPTGTTTAITDGTVTWNYQGPALPTEADFRAAYFQMQSAIIGFKRDNGKPFFRPTLEPVNDFVLEVPSVMQDVATKALTKSLVNGGETNVVVNPPKIVAVPAFTDTLSIYLQRVGQPLKPFVFQARQPLARQMKGLDDREFRGVKFMTDARYNLGYLAWFNACKLTFA